MKKLIYLLLLSNLVGLTTMATTTPQNNNIKQKIGAQKFSTLNTHHIQRISNIVTNLTPTQQKKFYISFNHHYNATSQSRKKDIVGVKLSTLNYRNPSKISETDIDRVIGIAQKHATT